MHKRSLVAMALATPASALLRFGYSQLVVERIDPLVNPGQAPSPHLHQIIGGNALNISMDPKVDIGETATCTTCQFSEDFSNYWTASLFFQHKNGSVHRVPQIPNAGFEGSVGGMTVYYMQDGLANYQQTSKVTAFRQGFRQLVGEASYRTKKEAQRFRQITYTCLGTMGTRFPESMNLPDKPCKVGIMANVRFPTCWDGKNLDTPDHMAHMAYPKTGTFESGGSCPASHPVRVPQLMYETIFNTSLFNDKSMWPNEGKQPFVWSMGDKTGYGSHGDYIFGWKGDSLQRAMDTACYVNCPSLKTQNLAAMNKCSIEKSVTEPVDGWLDAIPGFGHEHD